MLILTHSDVFSRLFPKSEKNAKYMVLSHKKCAKTIFSNKTRFEWYNLDITKVV